MRITYAILYWLSNLLDIILYPQQTKFCGVYTCLRITWSDCTTVYPSVYSCNLIWTIFCNGESVEILTSYSDCFWPQCDLNLRSFGQGHWQCVKRVYNLVHNYRVTNGISVEVPSLHKDCLLLEGVSWSWPKVIWAVFKVKA